MQTLRQTYKKYQEQAYARKPTYPPASKALKSVKLAQDEITRMQNVNDYTTYDETVFYKEKFEQLYDIISKYQNKKMSKQMYEQQIKTLIARDYAGMSMVQSQMVDTRRKQTPIAEVSPASRNKSKSPLKQFFDDQQLKNSKKVTFSNLLSAQQTPLKYGLRSTFRSRSPSTNLNDGEIRRLKEQNQRLRTRLQSQKSVTGNQDQYRELRSQIGELSQQNKRLKSEVMSRAGSRSDYVVEEEYEPYNIKVRENNIMRINSRNLTLSQKSSQLSEYNPQPFVSKVYYDNQSQLARSNFTHNPQPQRSFPNIPQPSQQQLMNLSHSTIQTQFLNLDQSEILDEEKNHVCREKIGFFKKSMVLYKGEMFDVAFKRSDLNVELDRLRIILYVNNKMGNRMNCMVQYDYERDDFDVVVKRKMQRVEAGGQAREEIQLYLKNTTDLGSLITAKVLVGSVMKKIIIPAMFIDFDPNYRYQFENVGYIERNLSTPLVIRPMGQFSTIQNTSNVIELTRDFQHNKYPVAKLYGKSKVTKGIVKLTWKGDKLKIETCEQWRTLMGYLFLNANQTVQY